MPLDIRGLAPLFQVYDMPASVRFYRDILGFELASTSPSLGAPDQHHWCLLRLGNCELMLNTAYEFDHERPAAPDPSRVQAHHDTCIYFGAPDVDAVYESLKRKIANLKPPQIAPYGMKQLYFTDPDGYGVCFQWSTTAGPDR
jgi:catechol 2,3-dioxygenase-like lactoylglutathione lyase family enzyme